jgi:hypothetical protein
MALGNIVDEIKHFSMLHCPPQVPSSAQRFRLYDL